MTLETEENNTLDASDIPELPDVNELFSSLDLPENLNVDCYKFILRKGKTEYIPKSELENIFFEDTFFGGLIRAAESGVYNENDGFELWEDRDTFMSIIESLRCNNLIVYAGVNLNYMRSLCDKWCITNPNLIEKLNEKINTNSDILKGLADMFTTFECKNCKRGFSTTSNHEGACVYLNDNNEEIKGKHVVWESQKDSVSNNLAKLPFSIVNKLIT